MTDTALSEPAALFSAANTQTPTMMFTVSHGTGTPRSGWSAARQRLVQGSMHFGEKGKLTADDIGELPFLPGGVWFMFACYSAGTPSTKYCTSGGNLKRLGNFRFMTPLGA